MSSELPPIGHSGSTTNLSSRRSSRDSQNSRTIIRNHDSSRVLISINSPPTPDHSTPRLRDAALTPTDPGHQPGKRSHLSPGSQTTGSSSQSYSNKSTSAANPGYLIHRTKSWCTANELDPSPSSGPKLETLFEQNGYSRELAMKPRPDMQRNYSNNSLSSGLQSNLTQAKRTKSYSNLTKTSENSKNNNNTTLAVANRKPALSRYQSDTSLNQVPASQQPASRTTHTPRIAVKTSQRTGKVRTAKPHQGTSDQEQTLNAQNIKNQTQVVQDTDGSDSDSEKNDRIIQWLIGVDSAAAEEPPLQAIPDEEPVQTDTAIHIVYDGD